MYEGGGLTVLSRANALSGADRLADAKDQARRSQRYRRSAARATPEGRRAKAGMFRSTVFGMALTTTPC